MSTSYKVTIEAFAETHYLKKMKKKYKQSFEMPWKAFLFMLAKFELLLDKDNTNPICKAGENIVICKTEFKVMPKESTKSSGNRCIVSQDKLKKEIRVLLIYHKSDIRGANETSWWKRVVSGNYAEYKKYLK